MRGVSLAIAAVLGSILLQPNAGAAPVQPGPLQAQSGASAIVPVAEGCGRGWHWVDGYRRRDGAWIHGHCERNGW